MNSSFKSGVSLECGALAPHSKEALLLSFLRKNADEKPRTFSA